MENQDEDRREEVHPAIDLVCMRGHDWAASVGKHDQYDPVCPECKELGFRTEGVPDPGTRLDFRDDINEFLDGAVFSGFVDRILHTVVSAIDICHASSHLLDAIEDHIQDRICEHISEIREKQEAKKPKRQQSASFIQAVMDDLKRGRALAAQEKQEELPHVD